MPGGCLLAGANIQRRARQSSDRSADLLGLNALILVGVLFTAVAILPALPVLSVGWLDHERAHKWFRVVFELLLAQAYCQMVFGALGTWMGHALARSETWGAAWSASPPVFDDRAQLRAARWLFAGLVVWLVAWLLVAGAILQSLGWPLAFR